VEFHLRRKGLTNDPAIQWPSELSPAALDALLNDPAHDRVVLGLSNGCAEERLAQVQARFPYISRIEDHVEGQVLVLDRMAADGDLQDRRLIGELSPGRRVGQKDIPADLPMLHDATTRSSGWDLNGREYGPGLHHRMDSTDDPTDLYEAEVLLSRVDTMHHPALILQLTRADRTVLYQAEAAATMGDGVLVTAALSPSWEI
ncbi:MAG: hypothetical protein KDB95_16075, partial [Flavobacteriales bacterium]|nr:hypothetical protein [Flavobacteriales bacterium]